MHSDEPDGETAAGGFSRFAYKISTVSGWVAGFALACICLLVTVEILLRSIAGRSTLIAEEMSGYLNVAVVFFGLSYALTRGAFIRVNIVYGMLTGWAKRFADWYIVLASLAYFVVVLFYMVKYTIYSYNFHIISTNISSTPQYIPQSLIIIGSIGLLLVLVGYVIDRCRNIP